MDLDSLIERVWAGARDAVGRTTHVELGAVRELDLDRFDAAVSGGVPDDIAGLASPLFLSSVLAWGGGPAERDLLPDGNAADPFSGVDLAGLRLMGGGQELTFHRDVVAGVPLRLEVRIAEVELKETRSGRLLVLTVERRYLDDQGLLTECRERFLGREELS
ncbi:MaoC family dehydratase N-terminal domain-containing protein [Nocardioides sp.]|uniref:FAS1-like dehydratase domain-containing protein n=1 Tax=Nocardioides sp. TaxID=35761 RepID=UPI0039E5F81B